MPTKIKRWMEFEEKADKIDALIVEADAVFNQAFRASIHNEGEMGQSARARFLNRELNTSAFISKFSSSDIRRVAARLIK